MYDSDLGKSLALKNSYINVSNNVQRKKSDLIQKYPKVTWTSVYLTREFCLALLYSAFNISDG